ncbi:MAG TPA: hypothetical protein VM425_01580 [Myxococcota bacterium]|nr:hypothetical protein [Myxococcota bacterium]
MKENSSRKKATIRGFVTAIDWNDDNVPLSMAIQTEDGMEVLIEDGGKGAALFDMEDAEVEVQGTLDRTDSEFPSIRISSVKILAEPDFEDDEEDDKDDDSEEETCDEDDDEDDH